MSHRERHRWVKEISEINRKINQSSGGGGGGGGGGLGHIPIANQSPFHQQGMGGFTLTNPE